METLSDASKKAAYDSKLFMESAQAEPQASDAASKWAAAQAARAEAARFEQLAREAAEKAAAERKAAASEQPSIFTLRSILGLHKVSELKTACKLNGISGGGAKANLVERLSDFFIR